MSEISDRCQGRWREILTNLGVNAKYLTGKHGPCPFCKGTDRYRFTDKYGKGYYVCNSCTPEAADGIQFVMKYKGLDFNGASKLIRPMVGLGEEELSPEVKAKIEEKKRRLNDARDVWEKATPITRSDPAGIYLTARTGIIEYPPSLRFTTLPYYVEGQEAGLYPAMVAYVAGQSGKMENVHRTYLTSQGEKAPELGGNARKMMNGLTVSAGCAIRLGQVKDAVLVSEGIETAISAGRMHNRPAWALINADRMRAWSPPPGVTSVVVAGDNDASFTGQAAAYVLANRLVCQFKIDARVSIPLQEGLDWNDVWRGLRHLETVCNIS